MPRSWEAAGPLLEVPFRSSLAQKPPFDARLGVIDGKVAGNTVDFAEVIGVVKYNHFVVPATIFRNDHHKLTVRRKSSVAPSRKMLHLF